MNLLILLALTWWLIGAALCYATLQSIDPVVTVRDLLMCAIAGLFGPSAVFFWITHAEKPWLDRPVIGGRK